MNVRDKKRIDRTSIVTHEFVQKGGKLIRDNRHSMVDELSIFFRKANRFMLIVRDTWQTSSPIQNEIGGGAAHPRQEFVFCMIIPNLTQREIQSTF